MQQEVKIYRFLNTEAVGKQSDIKPEKSKERKMKGVTAR